MAGDGTGGAGEINVKLVLSADDFAQVLGRVGFTPDQAAGMVGGGGEDRMRGKPVNLEKSIRTSPTFMSIFKPVAALMGVNLGIQGILSQSRVASTYLGAMGKMFGAAIDLLLIPFIPIFNLLMVGMGMLVKWLITSGILDRISEGVLKFMEFVKNDIWPPLQELVEGIKEMNPLKVAGAIWDLGTTTIKAWMQSLIKDPLETIAGTLATMLILQKLTGIFGGGGGPAVGGVAGATMRTSSAMSKIPILGTLAAISGAVGFETEKRFGWMDKAGDLTEFGGNQFGNAMERWRGGGQERPQGGMSITSATAAPVGPMPPEYYKQNPNASYGGSPITMNVTINEAKDPMEVKAAMEAYRNTLLAQSGREGK